MGNKKAPDKIDPDSGKKINADKEENKEENKISTPLDIFIAYEMGGVDAIESTVEGIYDLVTTNPWETIKSIGSAVYNYDETWDNIKNSISAYWDENWTNGDAESKTRVLGRIVGEVALSILTTKGIDKVTKAVKAVKLTGKAKVGAQAIKSAAGKAVAKLPCKPKQMHHFATNKSKAYTQAMKDIADKYGLDLNGSWNKELLPHQGRHPNAYHDFVLDQMKNIDNVAKGNAEIFKELFESEVKSVIRENPDMLYKNYWK